MQAGYKMQTADSYWRHNQITLFWLSVDTPLIGLQKIESYVQFHRKALSISCFISQYI